MALLTGSAKARVLGALCQEHYKDQICIYYKSQYHITFLL